jgi:peptidoglycan hydrolase CwlO-like protein
MADLYLVENIDIDLNSLFNLTYNFDLLKQTLEKILKNQKNHTELIKDLQDKIKEKDKKIDEMENKVNNLDEINVRLL